MKSNLIALTTATLFAAGGSMLTPVTVRAANNKSPDAVYFSTDNVSAKSDVDTKDLDAKLADDLRQFAIAGGVEREGYVAFAGLLRLRDLVPGIGTGGPRLRFEFGAQRGLFLALVLRYVLEHRDCAVGRALLVDEGPRGSGL